MLTSISKLCRYNLGLILWLIKLTHLNIKVVQVHLPPMVVHDSAAQRCSGRGGVKVVIFTHSVTGHSERGEALFEGFIWDTQHFVLNILSKYSQQIKDICL